VPLDLYGCLENAERCKKLSTEMTDLAAQEILINTAHNWERLAAKFADAQEELLAQYLR
jgi:hypothetical protein